nr:hypothetical protein JVH1_8034 [Rhodococcus sp. JVH1]
MPAGGRRPEQHRQFGCRDASDWFDTHTGHFSTEDWNSRSTLPRQSIHARNWNPLDPQPGVGGLALRQHGARRTVRARRTSAQPPAQRLRVCGSMRE